MMLTGIVAAVVVVVITVAAFALCKASSEWSDDEWF